MNRRIWLKSASLAVAGAALQARSGWRAWAQSSHATPVSHGQASPLSDAEEAQLGAALAKDFTKDLELIEHPLVDYYLKNLAETLGAKSRRPQLAYSIRLINSPALGAFSLPGGYLFLNRGLVQTMEMESEIAAALAHQIGHIVGRHALRRVLLLLPASGSSSSLLALLAQNGDAVAKLAASAGGVRSLLQAVRYSPQEEMEADLLALENTMKAGWDPYGLLHFYERLQKRVASGGAPYLVSHPFTEERMAELRQKLKATAPGGFVHDSTRYQLFRNALLLVPEAKTGRNGRDTPKP